MDSELILQNLFSPVVLFFLLGVLAALLHSTLEMPTALSKFFSLYLLMNIGLRGGVELHTRGLTPDALLCFLLAIFMSCIIPLYTFYLLKYFVSLEDSAAIAASYGSISLVTFITATTFLQHLGVSYSGYMVASMALMEAPAIIVGLLLYHLYRHHKQKTKLHLGAIFQEALLNGAVFLLIGSLVIGAISGEEGWKGMRPFSEDIFKGILALFLLDMGLLVGQHLRKWNHSLFLLVFALGIPVLNAMLAIVISSWVGLNLGDAFLLAILGASASYIAVPAAMRAMLPKADPSVYVTMALALSFPLNVVVGIPFYWHLLNWWRG